MEETLTLHRLGVFPDVGTSFKTTNLLERVMARVEEKTARVDHWSTSDQTRRECHGALTSELACAGRKCPGRRIPAERSSESLDANARRRDQLNEDVSDRRCGADEGLVAIP